MKTLQINVTYEVGSTGALTYYLHRLYTLSNNHSFVIHGRCDWKPLETTVYKNCSEFESNVHHAFANIFDNVYGGCFFATNKMIRLIKRIKPDVVHLHCCNGYFINLYRLFKFLKKNNYKVVITNHAEFYYTGNCGYSFECDKWKTGCGNCPHIKEFNGNYSLDRTHRNWIKMRNAMYGFNKNNLIITSVSPWVTSRSKDSPILGSYKHVTVMNGINTDVFTYHDMNECRKELNIPLDKKIYMFICSNWNESSKKEYFEQVVDSITEALFVIAGAPKDYSHNNVFNLGVVSDPKLLSKYYSACNKTLLLSKRETFSLPVAESLCSGTPVVGFYSGGPETVTIPEYSEFCEYGDIDALVELINKEHSYDRKIISIEASKKYSIERMSNDYLDVYKELLSK